MEDENFFVMFTNADIGLTTGFYENLYTYLQEPKDALSINCVTIPMAVDTHAFTSSQDWRPKIG
jgi:hypothetical protein